jgi:hypothetical protein
MRANLHIDKLSRIFSLDRKKIIVAAVLLRVIAAFIYDVSVSVTDNDFLLPDSKFYSVSGWYITLLMSGYSMNALPITVFPTGRREPGLFYDYILHEHIWGKDRYPVLNNETNLFFYLIGVIYFVFGYLPFAIRVFNILLSVGSALLIFNITKRQFGDKPAQIFLLISLFLPTQFVYSMTLCKDLLRMFAVSFVLWIIYGGEEWSKG